MQTSCLVEEEKIGVEGIRMQIKCLELEEKRRRVEGTRMQINCSKLEDRRRID